LGLTPTCLALPRPLRESNRKTDFP